MLEGKEGDVQQCENNWGWGGVIVGERERERHKQPISQHKEETREMVQRWRHTHADRRGGGVSFSLHIWLQLAGHRQRCPLPSPSGRPICMSGPLAGDLRGAGTRAQTSSAVRQPPSLPPSNRQFELPLESKCGHVCVLLRLGVSEEGSDGRGRRN